MSLTEANVPVKAFAKWLDLWLLVWGFWILGVVRDRVSLLALTVLGLTLYSSLTSNSLRSICLWMVKASTTWLGFRTSLCFLATKLHKTVSMLRCYSLQPKSMFPSHVISREKSYPFCSESCALYQLWLECSHSMGFWLLTKHLGLQDQVKGVGQCKEN